MAVTSLNRAGSCLMGGQHDRLTIGGVDPAKPNHDATDVRRSLRLSGQPSIVAEKRTIGPRSFTRITAQQGLAALVAGTDTP